MGLSGGDFFPFLVGLGGGGMTNRRSSTNGTATADTGEIMGVAGALPLVGKGRPGAFLEGAFLEGAAFATDFLLSGVAADLDGALVAATFFDTGPDTGLDRGLDTGLAATFFTPAFLAGAFFAPDFLAWGLAAILAAPLFFFNTTARTLF